LSAPPPVRFNPEQGRATVANTSSIMRQKLGVRSSAELLRMAKILVLYKKPKSTEAFDKHYASNGESLAG